MTGDDEDFEDWGGAEVEITPLWIGYQLHASWCFGTWFRFRHDAAVRKADRLLAAQARRDERRSRRETVRRE